MRLTTLFSIACSLQISASVYSQETKLSLDVNNQTIKEVLFKIEKQSGFRFIYESEKVNLNKKVSVHVKEQTVETILKRLFAGEGVKYEITENNFILINPSTKNESCPFLTSRFAKEEFSARCCDRREWRTYYRCERS